MEFVNKLKLGRIDHYFDLSDDQTKWSEGNKAYKNLKKELLQMEPLRARQLVLDFVPAECRNWFLKDLGYE